MRILKTKIANARRCRKLQVQKARTQTLQQYANLHPRRNTRAHPSLNKDPKTDNNIQKLLSSKNIMKNYTRALTNFALSDIARPYVCLSTQEHGVHKTYFDWFVGKDKHEMNCIQNLRNKLLVSDNDTDGAKKCKRVFQSVCEIFLKNFSVNWIFNSKVSDKLAHLKYRFKILRRVRDPQHFTYLREFKKKRQSTKK